MNDSIIKYAKYFNNKLETFNGIEGWCDWGQFFTMNFVLSYLDYKKTTGDIIEGGVYTGKSAGILNESVNENETLKLIDSNLMANTINENINKLSDKKNKVEMYNATTWCMQQFEPNTAKFVHVDACHSYNNCWNDIDMGMKLLKENGIMAVDDFFMDLYPQVTEAVYYYVAHDPNLCLFLYAARKAYICRKSIYEDIVNYIITFFKDYIDLTNQPFYLNKSSMFTDNKTLSIIPTGDNKDIKYYRGLDDDNSYFPHDFINILQ